MIDIPLEELSRWVEKKFDSKYCQKLEPLSKAFIAFYNLVGQVSALYGTMLENLKKEPVTDDNRDQLLPCRTIITRSLLTVNRMVEDQLYSLDIVFCEKFVRVFESNIHLLCTFYHSFTHCEIYASRWKFEKEKIVEGIKRLLVLHNKIKQLYKANYLDLKNISNHKKFIASNVKLIEGKREGLLKSHSLFNNFEALFIDDFYDGYGESMEKVEHTEGPKRVLMKSYFRILHQLYQAQAELEIYLYPVISFCEEVKAKKRQSNLDYSSLLKTASQILKPNYSLKNLKKVKMDQFSKLLATVLEQTHISTTILFPSFQVLEHKANQEQILECAHFIIDCVRELDKVQSGLLSVINEYKEIVNPPIQKKYLTKLMQYKKYMFNYYQCHESIKTFEKVLQESILVQFEEKINLIVQMH